MTRDWTHRDFKHAFWTFWRNLAGGGCYAAYNWRSQQAERWCASMGACIEEWDVVGLVLEANGRRRTVSLKVPKGRGCGEGLRVLKQLRQHLIARTSTQLARREYGLEEAQHDPQ